MSKHLKQNTSHAVMAQRYESKQSADDFPTPPWATRALLEYVICDARIPEMTCLEPACGRGYMSQPLSERFCRVDSADFIDYGYGEVRDFLTYPYLAESHDWVITNPPFKLAQEFIQRALFVAKYGVAILARTVFLESVGRYDQLFKDNRPTYFAQFAERVPMVKGRVDRKASTATGYAWFVWIKEDKSKKSELIWIPPCRRSLEKESDYNQASLRS